MHFLKTFTVCFLVFIGQFSLFCTEGWGETHLSPHDSKHLSSSKKSLSFPRPVDPTLCGCDYSECPSNFPAGIPPYPPSPCIWKEKMGDGSYLLSCALFTEYQNAPALCRMFCMQPDETHDDYYYTQICSNKW